MAVDANSYGSAAGVAAFVPMHGTSGGTFDASTNPTITVVESWIDQLSAAANMELENYGYSVPATGTMASWLTGWVNTEVAEQVRYVFKRTRRGPNDDEDDNSRTLLANIKQVRDMLQSLTGGKRWAAGSRAVIRKDAYSSSYNTTEAD